MGGTPDTWVTLDSDSLHQIGRCQCPHRRESFPTAACSIPYRWVLAVADSLQELLLSGVTHVSGVPPIYLTWRDQRDDTQLHHDQWERQSQ